MTRKTVFACIAALLALQACFVCAYLPLSDWFSPSIIYTDDYPLHYGDMLDKKFFMNAYCSTWGYNPYQRAGTVANVIVGIDNNAWALMAYLLPFLPEAVVLKLYFILLLLAIPLLAWGAGRNFCLGPGESLSAAVLGTLFVHTTICADFIYWGTVSYISSIFLSLYIASLSWRFLRTGSRAALGLQTLLLAAALWIHIFTVINCLPLVAALYLAALRGLPRRRLAAQLAALAAAGALSAPWVIPFVSMLDISQGNAFAHYTTTNIFEWANTYIRGRFLLNTYGAFPKPPYIDTVLMLLGIAGLVRWRRAGAGQPAAAFAATVAFLFVLAYFGSFVSFTRTLTPLRFALMMNACLILPAASALGAAAKRLAALRPRAARAVLVACAVAALGLVAARPYYHLFVTRELRFLTRMPREIEQLVGYIKTATTDRARILIENSDFESDHRYARGHFLHMIAHLTNREYIGNDCAYNPTRDSVVSFLSGILFQRHIETLDLQFVADRCDLYNIGWVICWSPESKTFFNRYPAYFVPDATIGQFSAYRVDRRPSFFLKGGGTARAAMNRIELTDITAQDGEVIISYHWMKYLATDPPTAMDRVFFLNDPIGFIRLKNPPPGVRIYNNYR